MYILYENIYFLLHLLFIFIFISYKNLTLAMLQCSSAVTKNQLLIYSPFWPKKLVCGAGVSVYL